MYDEQAIGPSSKPIISIVNKKNAIRLLPILALGYVLNTLDKTNIGFASLEMNKAIGLTSAVFGFGAGLFFVTYAFLEVPSNLLMARLGARRWLARILISWGILSMTMAFVADKWSFYGLRLLLGAAEAGWFPGVIFYLSLWFPMGFRARAMTIFWLGAPLSAAFGSPLSGALLGIPPMLGLVGWQWLFIIEGFPSVVLGLIVLFVLRDGPDEAKWLTETERTVLGSALSDERLRNEGAEGHGAAGWRSLLQGRILAFVLINFLNGTGLNGALIWVPRLIKSMGNLSNFEVGLLAALPFLFAALGLIACAISSDRFGERRWHIAGPFTLGACALVATAFSASPVSAMVCLTIGLASVFGVQGTLFAFFTEGLHRLGGGIKLAAGLALITTGANIGGFVGPFGIGLLVEAFGDFRYVLIAAACLFLGAAGLVVLQRKQAMQVQSAPVGAEPI